LELIAGITEIHVMYHESLVAGKKLEVSFWQVNAGRSIKRGTTHYEQKKALYLAEQPEVAVSFLVPKCSEEDKRRAGNHNTS